MRGFGLLVILGLAGCVGDETATQDVQPAPGRGSAAPEASDDLPAPEVVTKSLRDVPVEVPVNWDGKTGTRVGIYSDRPDEAQQFVQLTPESTLHLPPSKGQPQKADLTLTWTASNPLNRELTFLIGGLVLCGSGCSPEGNFTHGKSVTSVRGASPLKLNVDPLNVESREALGIHVRQPGQRHLNYRAFVEVDQAFNVEGKITYLAPAA